MSDQHQTSHRESGLQKTKGAWEGILTFRQKLKFD